MAEPSETLCVLRAQADLTQAELAERAGVSRSTVQRHESGDSMLRPDDVMRYARAFGLTFDQLKQRFAAGEVTQVDDEPLPRTSAGDGARIVEPPVRDGAIVEVWGDSMEPTLMHGDRVKVKPIGLDHTELHDGALVFVELSDGIRAWYRWRRASDGLVDLLKDNERYPARKGVNALGEDAEIVSVAVPVELKRLWVR